MASGTAIPRDGGPTVPGLRSDVRRRRWKLFFRGNRIAGTPFFAQGSIDRQMRSITTKHLVEQPSFDHGVVLPVAKAAQLTGC